MPPRTRHMNASKGGYCLPRSQAMSLAGAAPDARARHRNATAHSRIAALPRRSRPRTSSAQRLELNAAQRSPAELGRSVSGAM